MNTPDKIINGAKVTKGDSEYVLSIDRNGDIHANRPPIHIFCGSDKAAACELITINGYVIK